MRFSRHSGAKRDELFSTVLFNNCTRRLRHVDRSDIIIITVDLCVFLAKYMQINIIIVYNVTNTIAYTHAFRKLWRRFYNCISANVPKNISFFSPYPIYVFNVFTFTLRRDAGHPIGRREPLRKRRSGPVVTMCSMNGYCFCIVFSFIEGWMKDDRIYLTYFGRCHEVHTHRRRANFRTNNNSRFWIFQNDYVSKFGADDVCLV